MVIVNVSFPLALDLSTNLIITVRARHFVSVNLTTLQPTYISIGSLEIWYITEYKDAFYWIERASCVKSAPVADIIGDETQLFNTSVETLDYLRIVHPDRQPR